MLLTRARPADFLDIALLDRRAWKQNRHSERIPDGEHAWRIWVQYALTLKAEDAENGILGAALAFPTQQNGYFLHKIIVEPTLRNRGIGTKLLSALLTEIDKLSQPLFLTVDPHNAAAIRLYQKQGFQKQKHVRGFYRAEEDRDLMIRANG